MSLYSVGTGQPPAAADLNQVVTLLSGGYPGSGITVSNRVSAGLTGATASNGFIGGIPGPLAPTSGTFNTGDWGVESRGVFWVCTSGGTPGTWRPLGGLCDSASLGGPSANTQTFFAQSGRTGFQAWAFDSGATSSPSSNVAVTAASSSMTMGKNGLYMASAQLYVNVTTSGSDIGAVLLRNGAIALWGTQIKALSQPRLVISGMVFCTKGDVVQAGIYSESAASSGVQSNGSLLMNFLAG